MGGGGDDDVGSTLRALVPMWTLLFSSITGLSIPSTFFVLSHLLSVIPFRAAWLSRLSEDISLFIPVLFLAHDRSGLKKTV